MEHADHVNLLRAGIPAPGGVWADFGSGAGAFTLALADLLGPGARIWSVDRDAGALRQQERAMRARFPATAVQYLVADFTQPLELPTLDGAVCANALHFVRDKDTPLHLLYRYLRPGGQLIVVEYNTDRGNHWVPYPFSFVGWTDLARRNGFMATRLLARRSSRFLGEIYAAASQRPVDVEQNA
ncbi:MAG TPA: class I SAM-dependent methyltransferase [Thermomicrobiales bacterium]|nr:class I SAM-dependent methyltransferase [Thermomicrobiales bacterium]